ncbi:DUF6702 family protein [uncultured Dokdonia sp.]|uniref:DUF6702 family protein n=1 Tax=uncultured Dokdonia sp. TaxID=575653 RepID=UPI002629FA14|nr:DUF6702 family protein [uncultured Dokdonia sp.]
MIHKYYLSVTDIAYNKEEASLQIITRLFYDDLEEVLRERYSEDVTVDATADQEALDMYIKKYLNAKIKITVDGEEKTLSYLGKEYDDDFVVCYIEITGILSIQTLEIENTILMDAFTEQKNMIHTDILGKKKSLLLVDGNAKAVLNFSE